MNSEQNAGLKTAPRPVRIGVLGGSFNPIHIGHTFLAEYAADHCGLEKVVLIPTGKHAFDSKSGMTPAGDRMAMVELAIKGKTVLEVSDIEVRNPEKSYTYNTLRLLKDEYPEGSEICFITGSDEILEMERWYEWESLLREFPFIIGVRPGVDLTDAAAAIENYNKNYGANINLLADIPAPDVSSTEVRAFLRYVYETGDRKEAAEDETLPLERSVLEYILEHDLYRENKI